MREFSTNRLPLIWILIRVYPDCCAQYAKNVRKMSISLDKKGHAWGCYPYGSLKSI